MRASSFGYLSRQGVKSLWSNRMMTLASVGVLTACLLIVGVAVLLTENINEVVKYVEAQNEFKAFMYKEEDYLKLLNQEAEGEQATPSAEESAPAESTAGGAKAVNSAAAKAANEAEGDVSAAEKTASETEVVAAEEETSKVEETKSAAEKTASKAEKAKADEATASKIAETEEETPIEPLYTQDNFDWEGFCTEVTQKIQALPNVLSVEFVSKASGIEKMKEQLGDKSQLLDDYVGAENPLNDSFTIKVKDLAQMEQTTKDVAAVRGIYTVSAANEIAKTLTDVRRIINVAGWALVTALVVVSLVIIINTIRATIFSRRKELNIMRYVGATKAFIRFPFVVEGVLLGLLSAGVAYVIIWQSYSYALRNLIGQSTSWLNDAMAHIIPFEQIAWPLALFFAASSVCIGVLGSAVSIRNHIKV